MVPEAIISMLACARLGLDAFGGVRRILGRCAAFARRRCRGQTGHHHRRAVPARQARPVPLKEAVDEAIASAPAATAPVGGEGAGGRRTNHDPDLNWVGGPRRGGGTPSTSSPTRTSRRPSTRTSAVPCTPRHHRQSPRHRAHLGRLPDAGRDPTTCSTTRRDRRLLVRRRTSAG